MSTSRPPHSTITAYDLKAALAMKKCENEDFKEYGIALPVDFFAKYCSAKQTTKGRNPKLAGDFHATAAEMSEALGYEIFYFSAGYARGSKKILPILAMGNTWDGEGFQQLTDEQKEQLRKELMLGGMSEEEAVKVEPQWYVKVM